MFHRVHAHRAFPDGGGALDRFQVFDFRVDRRLVLQILALELDSEIDRRRLEAEGDFFAGVKRDAAKAGGFPEGVLNFRRRHKGLTKQRFRAVTRASFLKGTLGARRAPSLVALTEIPTSSGLSPILQQKARNTENSPVLLVTKIAPCASVVAAVQRSLLPIVTPRCSKSARILA